MWFLKDILSLFIDLKAHSPSPLATVRKKNCNIVFSPNAQQQKNGIPLKRRPLTVRASSVDFSQI